MRTPDTTTLIAAGTSATGFPAAQFPVEILQSGGRVTHTSTHFLKGPGAAVFERPLDHVGLLRVDHVGLQQEENLS